MSKGQKKEIDASIYYSKFSDELAIALMVSFYNNLIQHGFSPQVIFREDTLREYIKNNKVKLDFKKISWRQTLQRSRELAYIDFFNILYV